MFLNENFIEKLVNFAQKNMEKKHKNLFNSKTEI